MKTWKVVAVAVAASTLANCARARSPDEPAPEPVQGPVTLEVTNNNWADMAVYVVRSGQRMRLGTVVTTQTASLEVAPAMMGPGGEIRLYAKAIAGNARYSSPRIYAGPGGMVSLVLENNVRLSTVTTW